MKSMLMAVMAVAVAVTFSAPAFAGDEGKKQQEKKGGSGHVVVYGDPGTPKPKDEKRGGHADTFGDEGQQKEKKPK